MIQVTFHGPAKEPDRSRWADWCVRAAAAAHDLLLRADRGEPITIDEALYKEMREAIFAGFHGKCAYCEARFVLDQRGDVDHFRPKGRVTNDRNQPLRCVDASGAARDHPGYFWLAYDWRNLLPACSRCNRPGKYTDDTGQVRLVGKWDRFPLKPGSTHASRPQDLPREQPLLLNPLETNPEDHFEFDPATGRLIAKTDEARECDRILDLNREGLPEARRNEYDAVLARAGVAKQARAAGNLALLDRHLGYLLQHKEGSAEYAIAGRRALEDHKAAIRAELESLKNQLDIL